MCIGYYVSGNPPHQVSSEYLLSAEFTEVSYCPHRDADNVALRNDSALCQGLIKGWQLASVNMPFLTRLPHPGVPGQSNKTFLALILKCLLYCDCLPLKRGWSRITLASTQGNREEREQEYPYEGRDFYWKWGKCALKQKGYGGQDKLSCWKHGIAFKISFPEHPFLWAENTGKFCISHSLNVWSTQVCTAYIHHVMQALRTGVGVSACHTSSFSEWPAWHILCLFIQEHVRIETHTIQRTMDILETKRRVLTSKTLQSRSAVRLYSQTTQTYIDV